MGLFYFMAKDPAVLFYTSDFLSGTFTMTNEQVGKYIKLLCLQHQKGPLTERDMLSVCQTYDEDIFAKFEYIDNHYVNIRMQTESIRRKSYSESRKNNRLKPKEENISISYDNHMETENRNITINKTKDINIDFDFFWDYYDKKVGEKGKIKKKWDKLTDEERQKAFNFIESYKIVQPDKYYRKNPETFLNNKSWNDEIIKPTISTKLTYAEREWEKFKQLGQ
jgi:hypothetical protein